MKVVDPMDKAMNRVSEIFKQLQEIADQTAEMALAGCANHDNPRFRELMKRHRQLTDEARQILGPKEE